MHGSGITKYRDRAPRYTTAEYARAIRELAAGRHFEWHLETANWERLAREIVAASTPQEIEQDQTPGNYASRILRHLKTARRSVKRGDADLAAAHAIAVGWLLAEARIKFAHEVDALFGEKFTRRHKRGPSRLYRGAVSILKRDGLDRSALEVLRALKNDARVVLEFDEKAVRWTDSHGAVRVTRRKKFETQLSHHRARLRG
jgi:hypothetical protein